MGGWEGEEGALYGPLFAAMVVKEGETFPTGRVRVRHRRRPAGSGLETLLLSHFDFVGDPKVLWI